MYEASVRSSWVMRWLLWLPTAILAALGAVAAIVSARGYGTVDLISRDAYTATALLWFLVMLAAATWIGVSFRELRLHIDEGGATVIFGWVRRTVPRASVKAAAPFRITLWNAGGLGIRLGYSFVQRAWFAGWIARTGPGVKLSLTNGGVFVFSCDDPNAAIAALRLS